MGIGCSETDVLEVPSKTSTPTVVPSNMSNFTNRNDCELIPVDAGCTVLCASQGGAEFDSGTCDRSNGLLNCSCKTNATNPTSVLIVSNSSDNSTVLVMMRSGTVVGTKSLSRNVMAALANNAPGMVAVARDMASAVGAAIANNAPGMVAGARDIASAVGAELVNNAPDMVAGAGDVTSAVADLLENIANTGVLPPDVGNRLGMASGIVGGVGNIVSSSAPLVGNFISIAAAAFR